MSFVDIRKALGHTVAGVSWRLLVFLGAALCFNALLSLGNWSSSFAPSDAWGGAVEKEGLDWSPIVSAAAKAMAKQRPTQTFGTEASFYNALLDYIKREGDKLTLEKPDEERLEEYKDYRERVRGRRETKAEYIRETLPRDKEFVKQSLALTRVNAEIASADTEIEHLKNETSIDKKKLAETEDKLKEYKARRDAIFANVKELSAERATVEAGIKKPLADQEAGIKSAEDGIHAAFVAALPAARPVNGFITRHLPANWLLQVGSETRPLHIIYVVIWYGLEATIVFLLCLVWIPWLFRLGGDTSDPQALRSKVTEQIKSWIENSFKGLGGRVFGGGVSALAVAAVGGLALAGVTMAAGNPPSLTTLSPPESVAGPKGEKGEPGTSSMTEVSCKDGGDCKGSLLGIPPELLQQLADQKTALDTQARELGALTERLGEMERQVTKNAEHVKSLVATTQIVSTNVGKLSDGMGSVIGHVSTLNGDVSNLNASVGGLVLADQSILKAFGVFSHSLAQLDGTTAVTAANVGQVKETVNKASSDLPPTAGDLLRINAKPAGVLPGINPFYFYKITPVVVKTMERAMQGLDKAQATKISAALTSVQEQQAKPDGLTLRVWSFEKKLHKACDDAGCDKATHDVLEQLMPLIRKLSRV